MAKELKGWPTTTIGFKLRYETSFHPQPERKLAL
jgi:hypothetical protein